ncbi:Lysophospholipid acyltransferase lpeat2, partial [Dionaea muscipula]
MALVDDNLNTPLLLPNNHHHPPPHDIVLTIDADLVSDQFSVQNQSDPQNPFEFLGVGALSVQDSSTIDPFRNRTEKIEGVYEWVKILVCLPIALVRLVMFGLALSVGYLATVIALQGWKDKQKPMPKWRCRIMWITRICARCILFSLGYHWIKRRGRPVPREIAPIVVSNHVSFIEPIFFFYELFSTMVASESHDSLPVVGTIIRAMQVIYVNRLSSSSRKLAVDEIKRKASSDQFPHVLLFPEGTTTNGRALISFQLGAFLPGYPIQPVVVHYPFVHFDQSWGHISLGKLMFRMFTQFHNFMEVEYLPIIRPLENQKENACHFADRTGYAIASALNIAQTSFSYGDLMLLMKAHESKQENPSRFMVEMAKVETAYHISNKEAVCFLDKFLSMNPDNSGCVMLPDFSRVLRLKNNSLSEKIFAFLDVGNHGRITFKQFLFGSLHVLKCTLFRHACEVAFSNASAGEGYISMLEFRDSVRVTITNISDDEVSDLFDLFDCDGDGKVSKEDFADCLSRNPLLIAIFSPRVQLLSGTNQLEIVVENGGFDTTHVAAPWMTNLTKEEFVHVLGRQSTGFPR